MALPCLIVSTSTVHVAQNDLPLFPPFDRGNKVSWENRACGGCVLNVHGVHCTLLYEGQQYWSLECGIWNVALPYRTLPRKKLEARRPLHNLGNAECRTESHSERRWDASIFDVEASATWPTKPRRLDSWHLLTYVALQDTYRVMASAGTVGNMRQNVSWFCILPLVHAPVPISTTLCSKRQHELEKGEAPSARCFEDMDKWR